MKPLNLAGRPGPSSTTEQKVEWLLQAVDAIVRASQVDAMTIATSYTTSNAAVPPVRSLNVSTATASDVAKVLAQLLIDLQKRGPTAAGA